MKRLRVSVSGVVQGVGFRPFLHRRAAELGLTGWCCNTGSGVELEVQGEQPNALAAQLRCGDGLPPLAVVESVLAQKLPLVAGEDGFAILPSRGGEHDTLIAPDIATCPDCLRELRDEGDRRYRYPFINCTNCGPRFTIVKSVPYDRKRTSMAGFPMCPDCEAEYGDITDRRYHAQPDCCPECGPKLDFVDEEGALFVGDPFLRARRLLVTGGILAVKGLGGFHLACALDADTVLKLRHRKQRWAKPLAIMCRDAEAARRYCHVDEEEQRQLESPRRPIVLLNKRRRNDYDYLSRTHTLGVLLPYTPVHHLLFDGAPYDALVMTSANLSQLPAIISNEEAQSRLRGVADGFLLHNRDILRRCDDSLLSVAEGQPLFYRRSRGYAPQPITLGFDADGILALGAEQKASFAMGKENRAFYSQHIGDLKNAETLEHYESQIEAFETLFDLKPRLYVADLHPDFLSTQYGRKRSQNLLQVQHHHAHMCACMADNGLEGECIALTWDGTGLGSDGTIWGGETLVGGYRDIRRVGSIRPIRLPGGDSAIHHIRRIAQALCHDAALPFAGDAMVEAMLERNLNCPESSGMGRLFDGVYSLLTGAETAGYEGEGAVLLETLALGSDCTDGYEVSLYGADVLRLDTRVILTALLADDAPIEARARKFHNTLIAYAVESCLHAQRLSGLHRVVLSGGVFFNSILRAGITQALQARGLQVYRHHRVSPGDEGIALGQLAVAAHLRR